LGNGGGPPNCPPRPWKFPEAAQEGVGKEEELEVLAVVDGDDVDANAECAMTTTPRMATVRAIAVTLVANMMFLVFNLKVRVLLKLIPVFDEFPKTFPNL
jgi:hypothetical protein